MGVMALGHSFQEKRNLKKKKSVDPSRMKREVVLFWFGFGFVLFYFFVVVGFFVVVLLLLLVLVEPHGKAIK